MAKILIVEDDRNLQSIYGDRLVAEGHTIITASDGEEALAVAIKERPNLIISDVMMPKISGFDMLDILRSTPETRNVKIIMMTALSQAEDRERANKLGADKYLVKSQVTLDDVARTVNEVVEGTPPTAPSAPATQDASTILEPATTITPQSDTAALLNPASTLNISEEDQAKISSQIDDFLSKTSPPGTSSEQTVQTNQAQTGSPEPPTTQQTAKPISDISAPKPSIFDLYEKELAKESSQVQATPQTEEQSKA